MPGLAWSPNGTDYGLQWIWVHSGRDVNYSPASFVRPAKGDSEWENPSQNLFLFLSAIGYDTIAGRFELLPHYDLVTKASLDSEKEFICMKDGMHTVIIMPVF